MARTLTAVIDNVVPHRNGTVIIATDEQGTTYLRWSDEVEHLFPSLDRDFHGGDSILIETRY